jgi:hypothetical protein
VIVISGGSSGGWATVRVECRTCGHILIERTEDPYDGLETDEVTLTEALRASYGHGDETGCSALSRS